MLWKKASAVLMEWKIHSTWAVHLLCAPLGRRTKYDSQNDPWAHVPALGYLAHWENKLSSKQAKPHCYTWREAHLFPERCGTRRGDLDFMATDLFWPWKLLVGLPSFLCSKQRLLETKMRQEKENREGEKRKYRKERGGQGKGVLDRGEGLWIIATRFHPLVSLHNTFTYFSALSSLYPFPLCPHVLSFFPSFKYLSVW